MIDVWSAVVISFVVVIPCGWFLGWWMRGLSDEAKRPQSWTGLGFQWRTDTRVPKGEVWVQRLDKRIIQKFTLQ